MDKRWGFIFLVFLFTSLLSFSQTQSDSKERSRWSLGLVVGSTYAFHTDNLYHADYKKRAKLQYLLGITVDYKLSSHLKLTGGASFDKLAYQYTRMNLPPAVPEPFLAVQTYEYSMCNGWLHLKAYLEKNNFSYYLGIGPQVSLLYSNHYSSGGFEYSPYKNGENIFLATACAGTTYLLTERIRLQVEITGCRALTYIRYYSISHPSEYWDNYLFYFRSQIGIMINF